MRVDILTLFPETLGDVLSESILGRAQERGYIQIEAHQIRDYTANKQNQVDDYPYGGGRGAVILPKKQNPHPRSAKIHPAVHGFRQNMIWLRQ